MRGILPEDSKRKIRALIIEDDFEMAGLVKGLLRRRFSIESQIAGDCSSARRLLRSSDFDLITLDYRLPDGAGLDLLDEITTSIEHPPVIMVTGHGDEETAARSFRSRASGYVVKDARLPDMLSGAVEKALSEIALKKVEKELLDEKAFIEDALNSLPDLFTVLDIHGNFFRWNRRVSEVTGYSNEEISSMNILDLFAPGDAGTLLEGMKRMKSGQDMVVDRVVLVTKTGEKKDYELCGRLLKGHDGTPIGFAGTGRDISERARMDEELQGYRERLEEIVAGRERELEEAREQYRRQAEELIRAQASLKSIEDTYHAVVDHSLDAIAILDRSGVFLSANPAGASIAGYGPGELVGMNIFEMIHPDDLPELLRVHAEAFGDPGLVKAVDVRMLNKGGGWRILETVGHTFTTADGEVRVVVTARDVTEARKAEEETRKFKTIADSANYGVVILDTQGRQVYVNECFARAHGYETGELIGQPVELVHTAQGQMERVRELIEVIAEKGGFEAEEVWHTRKDGSVFPMLMSGFQIKDDQGNPLYTAATAIDITDQKRAERQQRESEQVLRMITDNMADIIAYLDTDGYYRYVSPSFETLLGHSAEETLGRSAFDFLDLVHPDDVGTFMGTLVKELQSFEPERTQYRFKRADGQYVWLESMGVPLTGENGELLGAVIASREITESKLAEQEMLESEAKYRSIFDLSPDIIYLVDRQGRIIDANACLCEGLGMTLEELRSYNFMDFFAGYNREELERALEKLWSGESVKNLEISALVGGEERYYEINAIPIIEDEEIKYLLNLARNITERKRTEQELRMLNSELEGYARTVSHDLRSPLTSIKLAGETLERTWEKRDEVEDLDAEIRRIAEIIELSAGQAEDLIKDLLTLAMSGDEPEDISDVDVTQTVARVIEEQEPLVRETGADVSVEGDLGTVRANPVHVYQLFSNFINNAITHNDKPDPKVWVRYLGSDCGLHTWAVEDNGPGIPTEALDSIFLPFFKGENGYTGIGLAIVDRIIKLYGGSVRVSSDGGARFEFSMRDR